MVKTIKVEVICSSCGKIFKLKPGEVKRCPQCGKIHRGPDAPEK